MLIKSFNLIVTQSKAYLTSTNICYIVLSMYLAAIKFRKMLTTLLFLLGHKLVSLGKPFETERDD